MRFLADENFDWRILDGLAGRPEVIDVVRVQDVGLRSTADPVILTWAADHGRILLTHDVSTMPGFAAERVRAGRKMPGVVVVPSRLGVGRAVADLILFAVCTDAAEHEGVCVFLPI